MRANRAANQLRIIGGRWRGRKLKFAPLPGLRPTPDRVRETLFNWLAPVIHDARCLDLYAGSGALGLEAASRGAASVTLVDRAADVCAVLQEQLATLDADDVRLVQADVMQWLRGAREQFDIVFLDPPFREQYVPTVIGQLAAGDLLAGAAWIYIESERDLQPDWPPGWEVYREKQAGQVAYRLIRRNPAV